MIGKQLWRTFRQYLGESLGCTGRGNVLWHKGIWVSLGELKWVDGSGHWLSNVKRGRR